MAIEYNRKCDEIYMICDVCGVDAEELYQDELSGEYYCEDCMLKHYKKIDYDRAWEIAMEEEEERKVGEDLRYVEAKERYYEEQEEMGKCISKGIEY